MRRFAAVSCFAAVVLAAACDAGGGRILTVTATGTNLGVAFLDRNANGTLDTGDTPLAGVRVSAFPRAGGAAVGSAVTNQNGVYTLTQVPAGSYRLVVDSATLGDSLRIARFDSADVTLGAHDTVRTFIAMGFPAATAAAARTLAIGRRVEVAGLALNGWSAFGDSSISVVDATGAIRATRIAPVNAQAGDSIAVVGTTALVNGQPALTAGTATILASGRTLPAPTKLATSAAASAGGGRYDAFLAHVDSALILSAQLNPNGDLALSVDDSSGIVDVVLSVRGSFPNVLAYVPGALMSASGILTPASTAGRWVLRPRSDADLKVSYRAVTIAQARKLQTGRRVQLTGRALNAWFAFGDASVHLMDATGTIRATTVGAVNLFAGDSVRLVGTVATLDGQTILTNVTATVLASAASLQALPPPQPLSSASAASAAAGTLDAALVRVPNAVVKDSLALLPTGDYAFHVDDGSGVLQIVLARAAGFATAPFVRGATIDFTGLLIPNQGGGSWSLKPRAATDTFIH